MLFPQDIIETLANCAYWADKEIRSELSDGIIETENDYTSNLTGALRREINSRNIENLRATVKILSPTLERENGADACIIFENTTHFKVGIFEAKWPRLKTHKDYWDSIQKRTRQSHFHDQLTRQSMQAHVLAVWEMFYCEYSYGKQPDFMEDDLSTCVWHSDALTASNSRSSNTTPWTDIELQKLLSAHKTNLPDIVRQICECTQGQLLQKKSHQNTFEDFGLPQTALVISYNADFNDKS
ncbi:hypothetical protein WCL09_10365 [Pseudomonas koreensis]|uniref:hypothetical protein n=1 Tax=Pseudomonas koreensis TaxID=198620 RepID=UPI0030183364